MQQSKHLKLVIELEGDEVDTFYRLVGTDDVELQRSIAKSLVLGAGRVVEPEDVQSLIDTLVEFYEFGIRGDLRASQEMANAVLYTRAQLNEQAVKDTITSWATSFKGSVEELVAARATPVGEQYEWVCIADRAQFVLDTLRSGLARAVTRGSIHSRAESLRQNTAEAKRRSVRGFIRAVSQPAIDATSAPIGEPDDVVYPIPGPE